MKALEHAVGLLTLAMVVWNTAITRNMLSELRRQRRVFNLPTFTAQVTKVRDARVLELTNVGKGIAFDVSVDDATIQFSSSAPQIIQFNTALKVGPGESALLSTQYAHEPPLEDFWSEHDLTFLGPYASSNTTIVIRFQDIEGTRYYQRPSMGRDGYKHDKAHREI